MANAKRKATLSDTDRENESPPDPKRLRKHNTSAEGLTTFLQHLPVSTSTPRRPLARQGNGPQPLRMTQLHASQTFGSSKVHQESNGSIVPPTSMGGSKVSVSQVNVVVGGDIHTSNDNTTSKSMSIRNKTLPVESRQEALINDSISEKSDLSERASVRRSERSSAASLNSSTTQGPMPMSISRQYPPHESFNRSKNKSALKNSLVNNVRPSKKTKSNADKSKITSYLTKPVDSSVSSKHGASSDAIRSKTTNSKGKPSSKSSENGSVSSEGTKRQIKTKVQGALSTTKNIKNKSKRRQGGDASRINNQGQKKLKVQSGSSDVNSAKNKSKRKPSSRTSDIDSVASQSTKGAVKETEFAKTSRSKAKASTNNISTVMTMSMQYPPHESLKKNRSIDSGPSQGRKRGQKICKVHKGKASAPEANITAKRKAGNKKNADSSAQSSKNASKMGKSTNVNSKKKRPLKENLVQSSSVSKSEEEAGVSNNNKTRQSFLERVEPKTSGQRYRTIKLTEKMPKQWKPISKSNAAFISAILSDNAQKTIHGTKPKHQADVQKFLNYYQKMFMSVLTKIPLPKPVVQDYETLPQMIDDYEKQEEDLNEQMRNLEKLMNQEEKALKKEEEKLIELQEELNMETTDDVDDDDEDDDESDLEVTTDGDRNEAINERVCLLLEVDNPGH